MIISHMRDTLESVDISSTLGQLFDNLNGIHFFLKDADSRHLLVSEQMLNSLGLPSEGVVGKRDVDIYSVALAEKYREDDLKVMNEGQPLLGMIELFLNEQGVPSWHSTNKYPVFDRDKKVVGVMGTISKLDGGFVEYRGHHSLVPALDYIEKHYNENIAVETLAEHCSMGVRSLQRAFQKHLLTTPKKFIIKRRCFEACFLLKDHSLELSEVAQGAGFYDQSDFSRQFQAVMHITPTQYRQRYA